MFSYWAKLADTMDRAVDGLLDEPVELHPWLSPDLEQGRGPDPARPIVKTNGIYVTPGATIVGEGGTSGGMNSKTLEADTWLSIRASALIVPLTEWRQGDRVYFPKREEWWEINYPPGMGATFRPNIHLVRVQEGTA